ncbi:MAG: DUF2459 domain-containing protein [Verrucomicrobiota bacterium]
MKCPKTSVFQLMNDPAVPLPFWRRWWRRLMRAVGILIGVPALYTGAGFGLGAIHLEGKPAGPGGIDIWLVSNGMHTGVVIPAAGPGYDLRRYFAAPPEYQQAEWILAGWGDREFFEKVPQWSDLTLSLGAASLIGVHETALSVIWVHDHPSLFSEQRQLRATAAQVRQLADFIQTSAGPAPGGGAQILILPRDTPGETFYRARGRYHLLRTCNNWTSQALAAADLPRGLWTPFAPSVMQHWPRTPGHVPAGD